MAACIEFLRRKNLQRSALYASKSVGKFADFQANPCGCFLSKVHDTVNLDTARESYKRKGSFVNDVSIDLVNQLTTEEGCIVLPTYITQALMDDRGTVRTIPMEYLATLLLAHTIVMPVNVAESHWFTVLMRILRWENSQVADSSLRVYHVSLQVGRHCSSWLQRHLLKEMASVVLQYMAPVWFANVSVLDSYPEAGWNRPDVRWTVARMIQRFAVFMGVDPDSLYLFTANVNCWEVPVPEQTNNTCGIYQMLLSLAVSIGAHPSQVTPDVADWSRMVMGRATGLDFDHQDLHAIESAHQAFAIKILTQDITLVLSLGLHACACIPTSHAHTQCSPFSQAAVPMNLRAMHEQDLLVDPVTLCVC